MKYCNNEELYRKIISYRQNKEGKQLDSIVKDFYSIAKGISTTPSFNRYKFIEDMIGDSIEACLKLMKNFTPNKSNNPFSYFSQVIYTSFLRSIKKEYEQNNVIKEAMEREEEEAEKYYVNGNTYYRKFSYGEN